VGIAVGKYDISMSNSFQQMMWKYERLVRPRRMTISEQDTRRFGINMSLSKGLSDLYKGA
jgi:hypothetical protein